MGGQKLKVGVLVSGRGSNLQALIDACADPAFPAEIVTVVSNVPGVYALDRAAAAGIATAVVSHRDFPNRETFDQAVDAVLRAAGVEFVCLAGFMRLLSDGFVQGWLDRMMNIHPSLLPLFKGLHTHQQALDAGVRVHGCTVHMVRPALDSGPIVVQAVVPVLPGDTAERLASRVLEQEHLAYPLALRLIAEGRAVVNGTRVEIIGDDDGVTGGSLMNPAP